MIPLGERIGDAILLGPPFMETWSQCLWHGAWVGEGAPRVVVVKRLRAEGIADEEQAFFAETMRVRAAMPPGDVPRLLQVIERDGRAIASVEEDAGHISLSELARGLAQTTRPPFALGLDAASAMTRALAALEAGCPGTRVAVTPSGLRVGWDGRIRVIAKPYPGPDHQVHGAATGVITASFHWLAPEIVTGEVADPRTPMFSIGLMLWEAFTGRYPFASMNALAVLRALVEDEVPDIATVRADTPPAVRELVTRLTRRRPPRYADWAELVVAIDKALEEVPPIASTDVRALAARAFPTRFVEAERREAVASRLDPSRAPAASPGLVPIDVARLGQPTRPPDDDEVTLPRQRIAPLIPHVAPPPAVAWGHDARPMARADPSLLVDLRPVTCAEYARFLIATGRVPPEPWGGPVPPPARDDAPMTDITVQDAMAYADWAGKRLPTNEEWTRAVTLLRADRLGTGAVWEWTSTTFKGFGWVVRGGPWRNRPGEPPRPENESFEVSPAGDVGFRCVAPGGE